jgi:hypothetical protein
MSVGKLCSCLNFRDTSTNEALWVYIHVLLVHGAQSRVVQAPKVRPIQVIQKDGVRDLFDRDSSNIFGSQDRKGYGSNC